MEDNIHGTAEILNACCEAFVERARGWYGFNINHVEERIHESMEPSFEIKFCQLRIVALNVALSVRLEGNK